MSSHAKKRDDAPAAPTKTALQKAFTRGSEWNKADLLPVVHWARQIVSLVLGIVFAVAGVVGFPGVVGFAVISSLCVFLYYSVYLGVDAEEIGQWELLTEGAFPSFGLFVLAWTAVHSSLLQS